MAEIGVRSRGHRPRRGNRKTPQSPDGYGQVYDGEWVDFKAHTYLACCDCALVHLLSIRRRGRKIQLRWYRHPRMTRALRKKSGKAPKALKSAR